MKKILTILLSLTMCFCLINLNSKRVEAQQYTLQWDGNSFQLQQSYTSFNKGDRVYIVAYNTACQIVDPYGVTTNVAVGSSQWYYVEHDGTTYSASSNVVTFADQQVIKCDGLKFDGIGWYNGSNPITVDTSPSSNIFGITSNGVGGYVFTKELSITTDSSTNSTLTVNGDLSIVLAADIKLVHTYGASGTIISQNPNNNLTIHGNDHKLILDGQKIGVHKCINAPNKPTTLNNLYLEAKGNCNDYAVDIYTLNTSGSEIIVNNTNAGDYATAIRTVNDIPQYVKDAYDFYGSTNASPADASELKVAARDGSSSGIFKINNYTDVAKYVKIVLKPVVSAETTSSVSNPVYKDESCEAVIGPRWHWNNDKGVCEEEYSVINTATK